MLAKLQGQQKRPREDITLRRWGLVRQAPNIAYHATRLREVEGPHFGKQSSHHQVANPKCGPSTYGAWTGAGARDGASRILVSTVTHLMSSKLNDFSSPPSDPVDVTCGSYYQPSHPAFCYFLLLHRRDFSSLPPWGNHSILSQSDYLFLKN